jgi:hypothetical protein
MAVAKRHIDVVDQRHHDEDRDRRARNRIAKWVALGIWAVFSAILIAIIEDLVVVHGWIHH